MKAYKIELLMLNFEGYDAEQIRVIAENARGLESSVMAIEGREIGEWSDDHPLNHRATAAAEYARLFGAASPVQGAASATDQGAAVKPWGERWKTHHSTVDEAKDAEIADWRALAKRAQSQHPTEKLLRIIAYAYQIAGAHNVPEHILDVLCDPEEATNAQVEAMLPYQPAAQPSGAVMTAFKELVGKNTRRRPRIVGNDVEYRNEIDTYQIGRDAIDIAYGKANTATPVPKQEAAQVAPEAQEAVARLADIREEDGEIHFDVKWIRPSACEVGSLLYTAPVPAATPAEQPQGDVMRPFGAPAGQHDAGVVGEVAERYGKLLAEKRNADAARGFAQGVEYYIVDGIHRAVAELASGSREGRDGCTKSGASSTACDDQWAANTNKGGDANG